MFDPKMTKAMGDGAGINPGNVIEVAMGDLSEKDQNDLELKLQRKMEGVMAERRKKKLACFQKAKHGVVKKGDMVKASTPVNSPFTLEELVQLIDASVNSKYGVDLEGITRTLTDSVKGTVESLRLEFKQESKKMPREIRAMVQQVLGESREKCHTEGSDVNTAAMGTTSATTLGPQLNLGRAGNPRGNTGPNYQQPFY
jgi:hypothetical protein